MNGFLSLAYLFFIGSVLGWVLELFYRRFFSRANPEHRWINPGFCTGPYVPLYGFGLCILYLLASAFSRPDGGAVHTAALLLAMGAGMTAVEYLAGLLALKVMKVRLWDYSMLPGNVQGLICPRFSLIWTAMSAAYLFLVHPRVLRALLWLQDNLAFSFVIGFFFGVFTIDVACSIQLVARLKRFAEENDVVVKYENLKAHIRSFHDRASLKSNFLFAFHSPRALAEHLAEAQEALEKLRVRIRR